jgi:hypothetical protein
MRRKLSLNVAGSKKILGTTPERYNLLLSSIAECIRTLLRASDIEILLNDWMR